MALDDGPENAGVGDGRSRALGAGPLPLVILAIVMVIILWLLWQFFGQSGGRNEVTTVTSTSTIEVTRPVVPTQPEVSAPAEEAPAGAEGPRVPDVMGDRSSSALVELENAGYTVETIYVYSDSAAAGVVIQQNPSPGVTLQVGSVVGLIVSRGNPDAPQVKMPDVIGLSKEDAVAKVKAAGLRPYILYGTDQTYAGRVGNQWPLGGTNIPEGSEGFIQVMVTR